MNGRRLAERLPPWMGSIRVRLTVLYSTVLFGLAALVVFGIYTGVSRSLDSQPVSQRPEYGKIPELGDVEIISLEEFERRVNTRALDKLREYSFTALALLFVGSLGTGWVVSGRVLRPIGRITGVAREIQATDLSRRINLRGPNDELRQLADTFDAMLARLDAAFESQRRFIHEASHELRNPLAVIRTNLDVALSDPNATVEDLREVGELVGRTAERMSTLVDDLLYYARQEEPANRAGLIDIAPLVSDAVAEFRAAAESAGLGLDHVATPGLWINADATAVRQALANLLANAVRLAPAGTRVRVAAGLEGGWVWLAVEDQGPGIPPEDQDRVWARFWRGDRRRAREEGRSGLGLTIVRQIVERHQGRVQLVSEVGRGSTFVLWFPAVEPPAPDTGPVPVVSVSEGTARA
ncbi:MAG TPA: HAMP domain-containing sensor histidine kinase [Acidimicrobiales bacterium]